MTAQPDGDQLAMLIERLADLEATVRQQQAEIALLRTGVADPRDNVVVEENDAEPAGAAVAAGSPVEAPEPLPTMHRKSRRALLKLGGAAAAASVAAVAASATELAHPGTVHAHMDTVGLYSNINGLGNVAIKGDGGLGAHGVEGTSDSGYGLYGYTFTGDAVHAFSRDGGIAVRADSSAAGGTGVLANGALQAIYGTSAAGIGVTGVSNTNLGVKGISYNSTGVVGSGLYGGYFSGSTASLVIGKDPNLVGPPNTGNHQKGELLTDSNGLLWFCTNDGNPGTWIRLSGPLSGYTGGAIAYLPAPIRIFDSRAGQPAPLPASKGALAGGSTTTMQVTGTSVGGLSVPTGAVGVIGNLTVTNTQGGGDLILYPHGAPQPLTSNINYQGGQTIANFASVALSGGGAMDLYVHVSGTDVIFDVAGYVF